VFPDILLLFLQEQLALTVGHELVSYQAIRELARMVSTRSRAGMLKELEVGPSMPAGSTLNLASILKGKPSCNKSLLILKGLVLTKWKH